ncbi:MAG: multiheme c-type cytochrome [Pirellulaceae bacterium]
MNFKNITIAFTAITLMASLLNGQTYPPPATEAWKADVVRYVAGRTASRANPVPVRNAREANLPSSPASYAVPHRLHSPVSPRSASPTEMPTVPPSHGRFGPRSPHHVAMNFRKSEATPAASDDADSSPDDAPISPNDPHLELLAKNCYPSARDCKACHEQIYREWSVSSHAYAAISPMFHRFEQTINNLANGTIGYFCMRCHSPVGVSMGMSRDASIWEVPLVAREGVTCIACHRIRESYYKVNGERRVEPGALTDPITGASNGQGLAAAIEKKDYYKLKLSDAEKGPGQVVHNSVFELQQIKESHFCASCHQVAVFPGIALEVVWNQYKGSPACKQGVSCQDCHMGAVPGKAEGYETAPTAIIGGRKINPHRKHSNHMFVGPGYSVMHPALFPHNPKADKWTPTEWMEFDWRAGWGTEDFEERLDDGKIKVTFPKTWSNVDDRYDAREILAENMELLDYKKSQRFKLMEGNSKILGPYFKHAPRCGKPLKFHYEVRNLSNGHNMPSGSLGAQPQIWLNVVLTGPSGEWLWESGYTDGNGDMADLHSLEVAAGRIRPDQQLFNLQTKFLTTHVKGPDREMYLPINVDFDQLPFIRPAGVPITTLNHPPFIRMEAHSLPALGRRNADYKVPAELIARPGRYRLSIRMRSRAEPIYFMRFCQATPEMERQMNENMLDFHQEAFEFIVQ